MLPPITQQIQPALARFLFDGGSLRHLRIATIPAIYEVDEHDNVALQDVSDELALRFAEDDHGAWSEGRLREHLSTYLRAEWPDLYDHLASLHSAFEESLTSFDVITSEQTAHRYRTAKDPQPYWRKLSVMFVPVSPLNLSRSAGRLFPRLKTQRVTVTASGSGH